MSKPPAILPIPVHPRPQHALFGEIEGWRDLDHSARIRAFQELPEDMQEAGYRRVREYRRPPPRAVPLADGDIKAVDLLEVDVAVYFERLAGIEVPERRAPSAVAVHCPLPDHEDKHPSCRLYEETKSWYCFPCGKGGDILTLGSALSGFSRRGADFPRLLEWAAERLR